MKALSIIIAAGLLALSSAQARIGETEAEIGQRYGKILRSDLEPGAMPLRLYRTSGMIIGVVFLNGRSVAELVSKINKSELSETEIRLLLSVNSGSDASWEEQMPLADRRGLWRIESKGLSAIYKDGQLVISNREFAETSKRQVEAKEKAKLSGF